MIKERNKMLNMLDFYIAWNYLDGHSIFQNTEYGLLYDSRFKQCLDIDVVKVNPDTNTIDDNKELNTKVQIWLEAGPYLGKHFAHDIDLDCGGNTFEEAIIELASLVKQKYGDDPTESLKIVNKEYGWVEGE